MYIYLLFRFLGSTLEDNQLKTPTIKIQNMTKIIDKKF